MLLFILRIDKIRDFQRINFEAFWWYKQLCCNEDFLQWNRICTMSSFEECAFLFAHAPIAHSVILKSLYAPSRITYTYKLRASIFYRVMIAKARTTMKHRNHDGSLTILRFIFYYVYMNVQCTLIFHNPIEVIIRRRKELEQFYRSWIWSNDLIKSYKSIDNINIRCIYYRNL